MQQDIKLSMRSIHNLWYIAILLFSVAACKNKGDRTVETTKVISMQSYIDSCADLYLKAINDVKQGVDKETVKFNYANRIVFLHSIFSRSFDSITSAYTNKKLTQVEYDHIIQSLVLDSVGRRSEELSKLGVSIELK